MCEEIFLGNDVKFNFDGNRELYQYSENLRKTLKRAERLITMDNANINPKPIRFGLDPPPFRIDDRELKFKYFWWYFTQETRNPFISIYDRFPENEREVECIKIYEEDGLPMNQFLYFRKNMFISLEDKSKDFVSDVPNPIRGVSHWRYIKTIDLED